MQKLLPFNAKIARYYCDKCKEGELLPDGNFVWKNPPKFSHTCNKCGCIDIFDTKYPFLCLDQEMNECQR